MVATLGWQNLIELRAEEPRRAVVSLEMVLSGNYISPSLNGLPYYNKPPVFNWLMAGAFNLFGSFDEWLVRLPSLLAYLFLGLLCFLGFKKYVARETALIASLAFLTGGELLFYGSVNSGEIDLFYSLLVFLQVFGLFHFYQQKKYGWLFLWSYLFVALGFLTKGLPSLAFQALTLTGMAIAYRDFKLLLSWQHVFGIVLLVAVTGSYFWLYAEQADVWAFLFRQFKEASQRTGAETPIMETIMGTFTFPLRVGVLLLPWSFLAAFFFFKGFFKSLKSNPLILFSALFIVVNIPIYWISGDFKARYLFMFLPFLCLLLSHYFHTKHQDLPKTKKWVFSIFKGLTILLPVLCLASFFWNPMDQVPYAILRITACTMALGAAAWWYLKNSSSLLNLVLVLIIGRLAFNVLYLPARASNTNTAYYTHVIPQLQKITKNKPIYILGKKYTSITDASFGPLHFGDLDITIAPLMAYQVPFYISRQNETILQLVEKPVKGAYHLIMAKRVAKYSDEPLFVLWDDWQKRNYVLVKL